MQQQQQLFAQLAKLDMLPGSPSHLAHLLQMQHRIPLLLVALLGALLLARQPKAN